MDIKEHKQPDKLVQYSFLWSEARLIVAAIALFLGGIPPALKYAPSGLYSLVGLLLTLAWLISGLTAAYLVYKWYTGGKMIFGGKEPLDTYTFFVMIVTGLNLGFAGLFGPNIGMSISSNKIVFLIAGAIYLITAGYLYKRWNESGKKLF